MAPATGHIKGANSTCPTTTSLLPQGLGTNGLGNLLPKVLAAVAIAYFSKSVGPHTECAHQVRCLIITATPRRLSKEEFGNTAAYPSCTLTLMHPSRLGSPIY